MIGIKTEEALAKAKSIRQRITIFGRPQWQAVIVNEIKKPLRDILINEPMGFWGLIRLAFELYKIRNVILNKLPEPTVQNTRHPNTHTLIRMRDKFFERLILPSREKELKAVWKFLIIIHAHDTPYRHLINRVLELWKDEEWIFDDTGEPKKYWK